MDNIDVLVIEVGVQGPAGLGVSAGDWNAIRSDVNRLLMPTDSPIVSGMVRDTSHTGNYITTTRLGDPLWIPTIDPSKVNEFIIFGIADITTAAGKIASIRIDVQNGTYLGATVVTPSTAGTVTRVCGFGFEFPAGITSTPSIGIRVGTSDGANATWDKVRVWGSIRPLG